MKNITNPFTDAMERANARAWLSSGDDDFLALIEQVKALDELRALCPVDLTVFVGDVPVVIYGFDRIESTDGVLTVTDINGKPKARFSKWDEVRRGVHSERVPE